MIVFAQYENQNVSCLVHLIVNTVFHGTFDFFTNHQNPCLPSFNQTIPLHLPLNAHPQKKIVHPTTQFSPDVPSKFYRKEKASKTGIGRHQSRRRQTRRHQRGAAAAAAAEVGSVLTPPRPRSRTKSIMNVDQPVLLCDAACSHLFRGRRLRNPRGVNLFEGGCLWVWMVFWKG